MTSSTRFKYKDITAFAKCPACGRMIELESFTDTVLTDGRKCPFCFTFVEKKELISSSEKYLKTTNALRFAEQISKSYSLLPFVFTLLMLELGITYFLDWRKYNVLFFLTLLFSFFCTLGSFMNTRYWISQFSLFQTDDEEFIIAKKKVRRAQNIWVWANIFNAIRWFIYIKFN